MEKKQLLLQNLKNIKDYWTKTAVDSLNPNSDLIWSENEDEYKILKTKLLSQEELNAYRKVQNEIIQGAIHSFLVMIDGGDELADKYLIDIVDRETRESLQKETALHEEFISYLLDIEEE
ncbi:histidine kinase [Peribacillus frigoritolerans]|uniref:histidine kinase n=1 Tax=Peribacillus frigoritolerans TaxID=450367 RepID=UPI003F82DF96